MVDTQIHAEKRVLLSGQERRGSSKARFKGVDAVLREVIDDTLKQVFKEAGTRVIYDYFENVRALRIEAMAENPESFSISLKQLLGSAAPVIEDLILRNLHSELQTEFEDKEGCEFSGHIKQLRDKYRC